MQATKICNKDFPIALKARRFCYFTDSEEEAMQRLLLRHGPAGVAIDASSEAMSFLKNSPFTADCGKALDHAVLMVGWDEKYWIIKNSWGKCAGRESWIPEPRDPIPFILIFYPFFIFTHLGTSWGKNGYLYLPRGENKCGIQMMYGATIVDPIKNA